MYQIENFKKDGISIINAENDAGFNYEDKFEETDFVKLSGRNFNSGDCINGFPDKKKGNLRIIY